MLIPRQALIDVDQALGAATGRVRVAMVDTELDPLDLVRAGGEAFGWAGFYSSPEGRAIGGLGKAVSVVATGPDRFATLDAELAGLPAGVALLAGFSFDESGPSGVEWGGFPAAEMVLPEVAVVRAAGRSRLLVALRPGSDGRLLLGLLSSLRAPSPVAEVREADHTVESRPRASDWRELVAEAVGSIAAGAFGKVVLARTVLVHRRSPVAAFDLVAELRDRFPECRVFGWQEDDAAFVGASPELLVAREADRFRLRPMAGSARRGVDAAEDRRIGDELLASDKDRREHAFVVEDAVSRLQPLVESLDHPAIPLLQRHSTVQHLATPISGRTGHRLLDLAAALHPTPAVGGSPRPEALAFIAKHEGIDRGWYAGGIGWVGPGGDGDLAVGLRCALVRGDSALTFAGNGIVAGSDPEDELTETRLKLRPMLDLLTGR